MLFGGNHQSIKGSTSVFFFQWMILSRGGRYFYHNIFHCPDDIDIILRYEGEKIVRKKLFFKKKNILEKLFSVSLNSHVDNGIAPTSNSNDDICATWPTATNIYI